MNNTQVKDDSQNKEKASLRGEAPQEHGVKGKRTKKVNPATVAARKALIAMSQEAQDMMEMVENGMELEGFEGCEKVNDFLLVMHKQASGCKMFKTFHDWKKAGYKVKKGSKSFRVWGSPLKAKKSDGEQQTAPKTEGESNAEDTFKFWPMCSLFNENQVEPIDGDKDSPKDEKPQAEAANDAVTQHTQDMGNNESLTRGLFPQANGEFLAMTFSESKTFKSRVGAVCWLAVRGLDEAGRKIEEQQIEEESATGEPSPFVTVDYQEQQEARKDRLEERAAKKRDESNTAYSRSHALVEHIPMGQPILVGHHSERSHRNTLDKSWNLLGKSVALDKEAVKLESRASSVGYSGISSNDPEAIEKLNNKLDGLVKSQETMKAVNKIIRVTKLTDEEKAAEIVAAGLLSKAQAIEILKPDHCGRVGFASYSLSNNNAEIRRTKKRIAELGSLRNSDPLEFENDDFSMAVDNGRVCIEFSGGKPSDDVRTMLKRSAFKWSRHQVAWVRKATANGVAEAGLSGVA